LFLRDGDLSAFSVVQNDKRRRSWATRRCAVALQAEPLNLRE